MNIVLDDLTAGWLETEPERECVERWPECEAGEFDPRCCRYPKSCSVERRLLPDQWLPLRELLTVECPGVVDPHLDYPDAPVDFEMVGRLIAKDHWGWCFGCDGSARVPLPEGVYDIWSGTRAPVAADFIEDKPLALGVHLRQVEWERVERWPSDEDIAANEVKAYLVDGVAYLDDDIYDRLAMSVDGGPPAGVLNVKVER